MIDRTLHGNIYNRLLLENNVSGGSQALVRRKVFDEVGYFAESLWFGEDWEMWLRIAKQYEISLCKEKLVFIRKHKENTTRLLSRRFDGTLTLFSYFLEKHTKYKVPIEWADRIIFFILLQFPKISFIKKIYKKYSTKTRRDIFYMSFGSIILHIPITLTRFFLSFFKRDKRKNITSKIKNLLHSIKFFS